ncbi:CRISPR-associated endonuclease Cas1 [Desulfotomaculum arcticum]|uniref:CRISPR-associated endonuclease Cas1 n=1 Tax=Desulfotruncus arcticus DSM 17038 TaxID=1121424 RepID=A0A1I2ZS34_9FIRM|nr:CRISPR-associated endonuclease Cas1 [Desulfotruncus arcticus]SFH40425.1 CRISPR-associated endonuclease Cas1 [Desulfotomaculum arcticum] [Desulfotruncus arcticus DSM 17038]
MNKEILVVSGYGIDLRVNGGGLKIKQGSVLQGNLQEVLINRGINSIEHLVILSQSGNLTIEAVKWLINQNIAVSFLDEYGNLVTDFMPGNHISGITKRRQATADSNFNIKISSWLLSEKFKGQRETLCYLRIYNQKAKWWNEEREYRIEQALSISLNREQNLTNCLNADSQRVLEAQSAAAYWHCFEGIPLQWSNFKKIPVNWLCIGNRTSPKSGGPRKAIDPLNACLNYLYAILETRVKNSCVINGVDPDFGIIHADHANRASLVFDLMEPVRPKVDRLLLEWMLKRRFDPKDFFETREGICKVGKAVVSDIVPLIKGLSKDITGVIKEYAGFFKNKMVLQKPEEFKKNDKQGFSHKHKAKTEQTKQFVLDFKENRQNKTRKRQVNEELKSNKTGENNLDLTNSSQRQCPECGKIFTPNGNRQKFCCTKHKDVYAKRVRREKRVAEGRCPQCGEPMPEAAKGTYKEKLTYCQKCADYWKKRYEEPIAEFKILN